MANNRLKKLTALLLSIVMAFSMVTEAFPAAFAAGEGVSTLEDEERNMDFSAADKTRRPGLYVDFLGDNRKYEAHKDDVDPDKNERDKPLVTGGVLAGLTAPGIIDQSKVTNEKTADNPKGTVNQWQGYKRDETDESGVSLYNGDTIFWVGVGISRMNLLELFQENDKGIYSAELGFYYDDRYIEPYTGATANDDAGFLQVIQAANLANYQNYKWGDDYSIVDARTALKPQTDPVTQEVIRKPDMDEIMGKKLPEGVSADGESPWKMTYVSIEKKTDVDTDNRFSNLYNATKNEDGELETKGEEEDLGTQYLLIIPFKLKAYDIRFEERVCLRLTRSAGLLSIGSDKGDTPYAAWERVTTRNPGRELKLMTDFQGDLNIFSGKRYVEDPYEATLIIKSAGSDNNTAKLTIENDPSPNPVFADKSGEVIDGLYGGTGMQVDVHVETGYGVTVKVYYTDDEGIHVRYAEVWPNDNEGVYTFIMPEADVTVEVIFRLVNADWFRLYLSEEEQDANWDPVTDTGIQGNRTVLTATYVDPPAEDIVTIVDKDSPSNNARNLPAEMVHSGAEVKADIQVHHDYEAVVWIYSVSEAENPGSNGHIRPEYDPVNNPTAFPANGTLSPAPDYVMVLPTGGTIYIQNGMPESDVVVYVTYRPAQRHTAILEVHHKDITPSVNNVAQLVTTVYTREDEPRSAYSGIVYEDDNNPTEPDRYRTVKVKDPFEVLDRVDASSAAGSGSLGGDGRAPMDWDGSENSLMALLYKATTATDLNTIKPLDLRWETTAGSSAICQPIEGLRKNAIGERYTDGDIGVFYNRLMEIKGLADAVIAASATPGTDPIVNLGTGTVTPPGGTATTYSYYDLSKEQIQAYLLDYEAHQTYLAEQAQYVIDKDKYDDDKAAYDQYVADKAAAEAAGQTYEGPVVREPKPPVLPSPVGVPALLSKTDAQARVNTWYKPGTATVTPPEQPTAVNDYKLEIRPGRQVAVVLEAESSYTVASSIIIRPAIDDGTGNLIADPDRTRDIVLDDASGKLVRNPDYQNEFLFDMPDYDCIVEVTYTKRPTHELKLEVVGNYEYSATDAVDANKVSVTGYKPNPVAGSITAAPITPLIKDGQSELEVLEGSVVTVKVKRELGYTASALVKYEDGSSQTIMVATNPSDTSVLRTDDQFTFIMPAGVTTITVTYVDDRDLLNAHLRFTHEPPADGGNNGYWRINNQVDTTAREGDTLIADITVQPGYYIYAIETYTTAGTLATTNPVTLSGNGWNNGLGGQVTATTTMPDAEYWVWVYFRSGPPESQPGQILRLQVNDPDNIDATKANNWAQATMKLTDPTPETLGPLGLGTTGGGILTEADYAVAGDTVKLEFHPDAGYFVESVELQPAGLGTSVTRTSDTTAEFTMPASSAVVVVTFRKETENVKPKGLYLHLDKTEQGATPTDTDTRNTIPSFTSPTILPLGLLNNVYAVPSGGLPQTVPIGTDNTGAAKTGEWVEVNVNIAPGWYIDSITASDDGGRIPYQLYHSYNRTSPGAAVAYDPTDLMHYSATSEKSAVVTFIMPSSDAHITVNYRKGPEDGSTPTPDPHEHEVELLVVDPENVGTGDPLVYADNRAQAEVSGVDPDRSIGFVGKARSAMREATSARAGETVTIEYAADTGYALEIILVTPSGLLVPVNYLDGSHARFTMPDSSVTAIVRFKKQPAIQYTANLVLHFPDGTSYSAYDSIGEGSFVTKIDGVQYDLTNKLYSKIADPGERLDFDLFAHDGYYISEVTVGPATLGVSADYTGAFGHQSGHVMMPAANIQINVYFKAGWPDDIIPEAVPYDLTLKVYDATGSDSTANFVSIAGTDLTAPDNKLVGNGQSWTIKDTAHDEDRVVVKLDPDTDCYAKTITVTDSRGQNVPWQYVPGGIAFEMTPAHVTVTVVYAKLPDEIDEYENLTVTLYLGSTDGTDVTYGDVPAMGSAVLTGPNWPTDTTLQTAVNSGSYQVRVPRHGQTQMLDVTPNPGYHVAAAYAVQRETGVILPLVDLSDPTKVTTSMPQVPNGGMVTFAMPEVNADVYVIFADDTVVPPPEPNDLTATLIVAGPGGSGSAVMQGVIGADSASPVTVTTRNVDASGADSLYAPQGTELTVDLTVNDGYGIAAIRVTDVYGNKIPYTWTDGTQRQFTLTMPAGGARVYVELEEVDKTKDLTAQVVVNNGGGSGNTAILRRGPKNDDGTIPAGTDVGALLTVNAGDGIYVDITVQTGYQIEYLKVVPAKYGIAPSLEKDPVLSQSPSFVMPGEDVVVYVKFTRDDRDRKNVTLVAEGEEDPTVPPQDPENQATIRTVYSGPKGPVYPVTAPNSVTAQAAPPTATLPAEWVWVDYTWANGYYVTSITVTDSAGNPVPFTQNLHDKINRTGQITFPMVNSDVTVTVTWGKNLVKHPAVLHVIDLDDPAASNDSWGKLTWNTDNTGEIYSYTTSTKYPLLGPGEEILMVPAGEEVRVDAHAQDNTYIQAAFVLYRADGQMIKFNFDDPVPAGQNGSGDQWDKFVMHPCRPDTQVDVYIYYTRTPPNPNDHSAVLMLDSPTEDTTSTAEIKRTRASGTDDGLGKAYDSVTANDPTKTHGYVTASDGDTITVTVKPAPGYTIDYVLMTPLGTSSDQGGSVVITRTGDTYTFTMPNENVAFYVKLKEDDEQKYKAYLHYKLVEIHEDGSYEIKTLEDPKDDWAQLSFTWSGVTTTWNTDGDWRMVPESATVTMGASITQHGDGTADYVLAAYVLKENGDMVPLSDALEGLTETHTTPDRSLLDGTSDFTMPGADVHAYVWFTNKKPAENWRTAVLTVFETDSENNTEHNSATLESDKSNKTPVEVFGIGEPGHKFIWVTEGETVTVKTKTILAGYSFVDATITHSLAGATQTLTDASGATPPPYVFTYTVGDYNSAVVVRYEKSELTKNPLNVVLIDKDNPGDGVTNSAKVNATGAATLVVASVSPAGARQRIPDILSGTLIDFEVTPDTGYTAVARLKDSTGAVIKIWPDTDKMTDPTLDLSFAMPNGETTLEIIYFKGHQVTLSVVDTRGLMADPDVSTAQMTEDAIGLAAITADSAGTTGVYSGLPAGTKLTASMTTPAPDTKLIGVLVIDSTGTRWLAEDTANLGDYIYTLANRDVEIRMIVGPEDEDNYLATVSAVNLPAGTAAPQIHVTPTANPTEGPGWTVAEPGNIVTVTVVVPDDYEAELATSNGTILSVTKMSADGTATFTMPADNTHVTVTYKKVKFSATILVRPATPTVPAAIGSATLSDRTNMVTADDTLYHLAEGTDLDYTSVAMNPDYTLAYILATRTASGVTTILDNGTGGGAGTYTMPAEDVTITVIFNDDNNRHHIAFVTTAGTDGQPDNAAQDIKNTTQNLGGGLLWAYGDENDGMKVMFTVAPEYSAVVTAEYADGSSTVFVTQQGGDNSGAKAGDPAINATATLTMPDADVKVTITYIKGQPKQYKLKLRLVGHGQEEENKATLHVDGYGSGNNLHLQGNDPGATDPWWSGYKNDVAVGTPLDLDAGRKSNYIIVKATIGLLDPDDPTGTTLLPGTEVELPLNEYGTTATNLHYMPGADAVVTVYYRLPYKATLFVVDSAGQDYNDGMATPGPADTADGTQNRTPTVTMSVDNRPDLTPNDSTTFTHTPIEDLNGSETVTTVADLSTLPAGDEIASVIATTTAGTIHLLETALGSGEYQYPMTAPGRVADDVDITVILRKVDAPKMYTATVYKVGHDNKPGNTATITNPTTTGLPYDLINRTWTGALEDDVPVVKVTTEPGYYAIVTAVKTGTNPAEAVPVLQWVVEGTAADPIEAIFKMPAHDVDVTVEYVTEKPKADMTLTLEDHDGEEDNKGDLYNDPTATPDLTVTPLPLTALLSAKGDDAPMVSLPAPSTGTEPQNPYSVTTTTKVDVGDYLALKPDHGTGYYIKSITFKAAGFEFDMLGDPTFVPRVPLSGGEVIIEFAPGKQSGRPYDPEHSERYNGVGVWTDSTDPTKGGDYTTGDQTDGNPNPDLSVAPMLGQQGWILAESADATELTVVVTVPTLYGDVDDVNHYKLSDTDALEDAGVDPAYVPPDEETAAPEPPTYKFYWWDKDNSKYVELEQSTDGGATGDILITNERSLIYADNTKGDFPKDATGNALARHYGYRLTLQVVNGATSPQAEALAKYIEDGGEIYVTATRPGYVDPTADPQVPWVESEMTQVIIKSDNVLKPYDPDNENPEGTTNPTYEDHWITSENRGDYLLVTVPMLNNKAGDNPTEVDGDKHRLQLHLQVNDETDRDGDIVNVTELLHIVNVREYEHFWNVNLEYDPNWRTNGTHERVSYLYDETYENEIYNSDYQMPVGGWAVGEEKWHGARFVVEIKSDDEIKALGLDATAEAEALKNADILRDIFDNEGTMGTNGYRMYITSDEVTAVTDPLPTFRKDDYTDFEVPRYYSLAGELQSWAPTHIAELTLYREDSSAPTPGSYEPTPWLMIRSGLCETMSSTGDFDPAVYNGHWSMEFAFKSSKLAGLTYQMIVEKTAHITYVRTDIELDEATAPAGRYDVTTLVFSFEDPVSLFCGDIAPLLPGPNRVINDQDRNMLAGFAHGMYTWNDEEDSTAASDWANSTFNPYSYAYAADLNGDGIISERDMSVLMSEFNWMRRASDYGDPTGLTASAAAIALLSAEEGPELDEEAEPSEEIEPSEETEPSEEVEPTEEPEPSESTEEPTEPEPTEEPEPSKTSEEPAEQKPSEEGDPAEGLEPSESTEEPIEPEPSEGTEPSEEIEPSEEPEESEPTEPEEPESEPVPDLELNPAEGLEPPGEVGEMPPEDDGEESSAEETENL